MGVCNCSMFCCTLLYVHSSIAVILMGKRELIALLNLSSWRLVMVERLFLAVPRGCLQFVILVFPDHTHLLFWGPISSRGGFVVKLVIGVISINEEQQHAVERCGIITSYPVTIICPENIVYFSRLLSAVYIQVHFRPDFFSWKQTI